MPTSTAPCNVDAATNKTILKDIPTSGYGALQTSNDWRGAYAKLELVAMGLMTAAELEGTADAEAPFCMMPPLTNANYEQRGDLSWWYTNLACDNMEFITAQQVEDISTANLKRLVQGQHVRAAIVVVMDGAIAASTPHDTVGDFAADSTLNWWHNCAAEMPGFWHDATYSRSTLSIAVADADKGCGVPLAQCSALTAVDQSVAAVEQAPLDRPWCRNWCGRPRLVGVLDRGWPCRRRIAIERKHRHLHFNQRHCNGRLVHLQGY